MIYVGWLALLVTAQTASAQAQLTDDLRMSANGNATFGYQGNYGNSIPSNHGLTFGGSGNISGSYYDPNFLNFNITPYYNQSRVNSSFQSLTDSSGVAANVNLFSGSHFPGNASYRYDHDSTGNFGLAGQPDFTTIGNGQGFSVGWSALVPEWPTFSVNYSYGTGSGNVYGTNEETSSNNQTLNLRTTYEVAGFHLNGFFDHTNFNSKFPFFLTGGAGSEFSRSHGNDFGVSASHTLPLHGAISINFNRADVTSNFGTNLDPNSDLPSTTNDSNYTTTAETIYANFRPTMKFGFFASQSYINNLSGYFYQNAVNGGGLLPPGDLGSSSNSSTLGGGANYQFTKALFGQVQASYYNQSYFGKTYTGTYVSGTVNYARRLWDLFSFSGSIIDSSNGQGTNNVGFVANVNYFHRFGKWETSGAFSYSQNVQSLLITYTTSYWNYNGNVHRNLGRGTQWTAAVNGSHSGYTNQPGTVNHTESYTTSLSLRRISVNANYAKGYGNSVLTANGLQPQQPAPGLLPGYLIVYNGTSYGGGVAITPVPRLTVSGTYAHVESETLSNSILSNNKTQIISSQLQYRLRKISLLAGYTQFSQGISAAGTPTGKENSYFVGVTRWFNFF